MKLTVIVLSLYVYAVDLEDVSSVASVQIVTIVDYKRLTEKGYECLKNLPRLKFIESI